MEALFQRNTVSSSMDQTCAYSTKCLRQTNSLKWTRPFNQSGKWRRLFFCLETMFVDHDETGKTIRDAHYAPFWVAEKSAARITSTKGSQKSHFPLLQSTISFACSCGREIIRAGEQFWLLGLPRFSVRGIRPILVIGIISGLDKAFYPEKLVSIHFCKGCSKHPCYFRVSNVLKESK